MTKKELFYTFGIGGLSFLVIAILAGLNVCQGLQAIGSTPPIPVSMGWMSGIVVFVAYLMVAVTYYAKR